MIDSRANSNGPFSAHPANGNCDLARFDWKALMLGAEHNGGTSQSINLKFLTLPPSFKVVDFLFVIEGNNQIDKSPAEPDKPME